MYNAQGELKCDKGSATTQKKSIESFWQSSENVAPAKNASKDTAEIEDFWQQATMNTMKQINEAPKRRGRVQSSSAPEGFCGGSTCGFHQ
jgi:hypothetical protein